jgi:GH18 family chitinase
MNAGRIGIGVLCLGLGCAASPPAPTSAGSGGPSVAPAGGFKIVGYFPSWQGRVEDIRFDRLTHINYAFVLPTPAGGLTALEEPGRLQQLVAGAHAAGVKVSMAIGGWNDGNDKAFEQVAADPALRARFVDALAAFVTSNNLDGVDIDWEYPDPGASAGNFLALMQALRERLGGMGKLLTMAVVGDGPIARGILPEVFALVDFVNIMAYDADEETGRGPHSSYEYAARCLEFWRNRGVPRDKAILGVPFYGKRPETAYRDLVARDPDAPNKDQVGQVLYNGLATMKRKTALAASGGGGIMIWEISEDTSDASSLLQAIREAAPGG